MTIENNTQDPRWVTHVRAVVHDVTMMPSPEIRAIARLDMFVDAGSVVRHLPMVRCFATMVDEGAAGLMTCTPVSLASTIWSPRPPAILVGYGSALWEVFTPAFVRGIARVDLSKVARLIWPEGPAHDILKMADYVVSGCPRRVCDGSLADRLASQAQAVADIFSTAVLVGADRLAELTAASRGNKVQGFGDILGGMGGDPRLAAMVQVSAAPMPPLDQPPGPWENPEAWFGLSSEELEWIAANRHASEYEREAAIAELARREARDEAQLQPRSLLRSQSTD